MDRKALWRLSLIGLLMMALIGGIAVFLVSSSYSDRIRIVFHNSSLASAGAFARAAEVWMIRGNRDALDSSATVLLAGSASYVSVVAADRTVIDLADDTEEQVELPPPAADAQGAPVVRDLGAWRADTMIPIPPAGQSAEPIGMVRVVFEGDYARAVVHAYTIGIIGLAVGAWVALCVVVVGWLQWKRPRERVNAQADKSIAIRCGGLSLNRATCQATVWNVDLSLTPKPFAVLSLLAESPGRVVSDAEMLERIWSDSLYASAADVRQCVYMLRQALRAVHPSPAEVVVNVKGFGYKLVPPSDGPLTAN